MKRYVYPSILMQDKTENTCTAIFPDLNIVIDADNIEDAYIRGRDYLQSFVDLCGVMESDLPLATQYENVCKDNPKKVVLLADASVKDSSRTLSGSEKRFKQFLTSFIDNAED